MNTRPTESCSMRRRSVLTPARPPQQQVQSSATSTMTPSHTTSIAAGMPKRASNVIRLPMGWMRISPAGFVPELTSPRTPRVPTTAEAATSVPGVC